MPQKGQEELAEQARARGWSRSVSLSRRRFAVERERQRVKPAPPALEHLPPCRLPPRPAMRSRRSGRTIFAAPGLKLAERRSSAQERLASLLPEEAQARSVRPPAQRQGVSPIGPSGLTRSAQQMTGGRTSGARRDEGGSSRPHGRLLARRAPFGTPGRQRNEWRSGRADAVGGRHRGKPTGPL